LGNLQPCGLAVSAPHNAPALSTSASIPIPCATAFPPPAGSRRSDAITLLAKRKTEKLRQAKLSETIDNAILLFELLDDTLEHSQATNGKRSTRELELKINRLRPDSGDRKAAEITKQEILRWLQAETVKREPPGCRWPG